MRQLGVLTLRCLIALSLLSTFFIFSANQAISVPACPDTIVITNPDGTSFNGHIRGDEYQAWVETDQGYTVTKSPAGEWQYAIKAPTGELVPSGIPVDSGIVSPSGIAPHLAPEPNFSAMPSFSPEEAAALGSWDPKPVSGTKKLLLVLVQFANRTFTTSATNWSKAAFDTTAGAKSIANFYKDNSFGKLTVSPVSHTESGNPAGVVTVTVPMNHPNCGANYDYYTETAWLNSALSQASKYVNFDALDTNGDHILQTTEAVVYFVLAGYEASGTVKTPNIWAHSWSGTDVFAGNIQLPKWALNGELNDSSAQHPMGVIAHELGHSMCGLPDLYDITYTNNGLGAFSLMSFGSWGRASTDLYSGATPVNLDAWCRQYLGWATPRIPANGSTVSFGGPLSSIDSPVKMINSALSTSQYYLAEVRTPTGWDLGLERWLGVNWGGGLLIQHIDETIGTPANNDINRFVTGGHQGVMVTEASTLNGSMLDCTSYGTVTHLFYNGNNSTFDNLSNPSTKLYNGTSTNIVLRSISAKSSSMTAVYGTADTVLTPTFNPDGGTYPTGTNIVVSCATAGATIHYTTNGVTPTESDPVIASGSSVLLDRSFTLKAKAWKSGMTASGVKSATYSLSPTYSKVYVSTTGKDTNNGSSWALAKKTIQAGISCTNAGGQVWVAYGTYPELVTVKNGISIYGGFYGNETVVTARNPSIYPTVIDAGYIGSAITVPANTGTTTVIDGFSITHGTGTITGGNRYGGGIYCVNASPTICNNTISRNTLTEGNFNNQNGAGIYCKGGSPIITKNMIIQNDSAGIGGGIALIDAQATVSNNTIVENTAYSGAGIYCSGNKVTINNNYIYNNIATQYGGGIFCQSTTSTIANNLIYNNAAGQGGGIRLYQGSSSVINNTLAENSDTGWSDSGTGNSGKGGGGMFCSGGTLSLYNNIIAFGSSGILAESISPSVGYNCVYGNTAYNNSGLTLTNTDLLVDPQFVSTFSNDFHLKSNSPCLDHGDSSKVVAGLTDLDGKARVSGSKVDIGAYEMSNGIISTAPVCVSISPSSGTIAIEAKVPITSQYADANGYKDIAQCYLLVNTELNTKKSIYLRYDANANKLYLRDDADSKWVGGYAPGSSSTIENSYCKAYCANTTVTGSGTTLTVKWTIYFKKTTAGTAIKSWMAVTDDGNLTSGWVEKGSYTISSKGPRNGGDNPDRHSPRHR